MLLLGRHEHNFKAVRFVFDYQNAIGESAKAWYPTFQSLCTDEVASYLAHEPPEFSDEKTELALQAADMFAWYQRRSALGSLGQEHHVSVWDRLRQFHHSTIIDSPDHLLAISTALGVTVSYRGLS